MKTKSNLKFLIVMAILLLVMCIFNANVVQATEQTKTPQEILNLVPDTIEVDMLESEVFTDVDEISGTKDMDLINQKITKIFTDNNVDLKALNLTFTNLSSYDLLEDIHKATIYLNETKENGYTDIAAQKTINIKYKNTNNYNDTDKNYVLEKAKKIPNTLVISQNDASEFQKKLENIINDKSIKVFSI